MSSVKIHMELAREIGIPGSIVVGKLHELTKQGREDHKLGGYKYFDMSLDMWRAKHFNAWTRDIVRRTIEGLVKSGIVRQHKPEVYNAPIWYAINYDNALVQQYFGGEK